MENNAFSLFASRNKIFCKCEYINIAIINYHLVNSNGIKRLKYDVI